MIAHRLLRSTGHWALQHTPRRVLRALLQALETRHELTESAGYHLYPHTYTSPLLLKEETDLSALQDRRRLPGIDLNEQSALALIETLTPYAAELDSTAYDRRDGEAFWFANDWFNDFDATCLYALLRHLKPKHYVELGCGFSSLMSSHALSRNARDGIVCDAVYADPHPRLDIEKMLTCGRVIHERVQNVPFGLFTNLDAGDVLFVDTSHVVKLQSDVVHALLTILPSLQPGVWIHFHDVFTPYDYPHEWVTKPLFSNNEAYAVEALLMGGDRYSIGLPLYLLWREHPAALQRFFPRGRLRPQSLWIRKHE